MGLYIEKNTSRRSSSCSAKSIKKSKLACKERDIRKLADFEYFVADPNIFNTGSLNLDINIETIVAAITGTNIAEDSKVLLQAIMHFTTNNALNSTVIVRIRKFTAPFIALNLGETIYETAALNLESQAFAAINDQISVLHVDDDYSSCEERVTYVLTVQVSFTQQQGSSITLVRPITFTGTEYK
ncbi:hypothetical protein ACFVAD_01235 [Sutcliffiella sp. NPDC057660]|uniref:hypothetical protein n=1 Tax=Sutcliffiella sp. NPDC057660 TaxID=3346199 RepID=UPI0036993A4E